MNRGWFETIQLLGLDVMGAIALAMLVLDRVIYAAQHAARAITRRGARGKLEARARSVEPTRDAWPPKEWRPSH